MDWQGRYYSGRGEGAYRVGTAVSMDWQGRYYSGRGEGAYRVGTTVSMVKGLTG